MADPPPPGLDHVFAARVRVGAPLDLGRTGAGMRRIIPILGGAIAGPRLNGTVLPGGADWQIIRPDGTAELLARYTIQTADGALVSVVNRGLRRGPPDVLRRLASGEAVDPALYYFRATPAFEVAEGPHGWLAEHVFVCTGERRPELVILQFYRVA